ncbi:MAG TPA: hypothetical protein VE825_10460 [Terriglobales bacterium]|jgi:hypothetical protein|nr:hypothetical protein [Terriglobales bacterium]
MTATENVVVEIGGLPIRLRCEDPAFLELVRRRYSGYVSGSDRARFDFEVDLLPPGTGASDEDVSVRWDAGKWRMERGDFRAEWEPASARGRIRQTANPYALDSVLRIVHTLLLAQQGGFLAHASSVVRHGRAHLFAGVSGAGKTTLVRLAPPDVALLTDEISYVTRQADGYCAAGTPFFGELARPGENLRAPIAALYLLAKGPENRIEPVAAPQAVRSLLANILFFAQDPESVKLVFDAAFDFVSRVPVRRLTFVPDGRVWEIIQ